MSRPIPSISADKGDIAVQISAYFISQGVPDTETPYWTEKWDEFGKDDPPYFNRRVADADIFKEYPNAVPPSPTPRPGIPTPPAPPILPGPTPVDLTDVVARLDRIESKLNELAAKPAPKYVGKILGMGVTLTPTP